MDTAIQWGHSLVSLATLYSTFIDSFHSETAAFFQISSLIRFCYEHLKLMLKKWQYCHMTWIPVCFNIMFLVFKKRALLVEISYSYISLNFYLFQNNFAALGPRCFLRLKRFLLEALLTRQKKENRWVKSVCHRNYYTLAINICCESMQFLWLMLLWHYRSYINTNILVVASRKLLTVLRLTFDLCFGFDMLHSRKCSPLSHIYVLLNAECIFIAKCFKMFQL